MAGRNNISPSSTINTPSIVASAGTILAANTDRKAWMVQNVGTNTLFVRFGADASSTVFHIVLKAGTGASDGLGGTFEQDGGGATYTGIISIAGTTPKAVAMEM